MTGFVFPILGESGMFMTSTNTSVVNDDYTNAACMDHARNGNVELPNLTVMLLHILLSKNLFQPYILDHLCLETSESNTNNVFKRFKFMYSKLALFVNLKCPWILKKCVIQYQWQWCLQSSQLEGGVLHDYVVFKRRNTHTFVKTHYLLKTFSGKGVGDGNLPRCAIANIVLLQWRSVWSIVHYFVTIYSYLVLVWSNWYWQCHALMYTYNRCEFASIVWYLEYTYPFSGLQAKTPIPSFRQTWNSSLSECLHIRLYCCWKRM